MRVKATKIYEVTIFQSSANWWDEKYIKCCRNISGQNKVLDVLAEARRQLKRRINGTRHTLETFYYVVCDVEESTLNRYIVRNGKARLITPF